MLFLLLNKQVYFGIVAASDVHVPSRDGRSSWWLVCQIDIFWVLRLSAALELLLYKRALLARRALLQYDVFLW